MSPDNAQTQKPGQPPADLAKKSAPEHIKKVALPPQYVCALELILVRNHFYRDSYRRLMVICLLLIFANCFVGYLVWYESTHQTLPKYFATTPDGTPIPLVPLSKPNLSSTMLLEWATEAATTAYTFNFVNFRRALQHTRTYFTRAGYLNFIKALKDSNNFEAVQKNKLVVHASLEAGGNPAILRDSDSDPNLRIDGVYTWQVQVPMLVTYEGASQNKIVQRIVLTMLIRRMSALESPRGVGIESFVVSEITK